MNTPTNAPAGQTSAQATLQTVLLIIASLISAWQMVFRAPWRVSADPCILAAAATVVVLVVLWITRWRGPRAAKRERDLFAAFLIGMPVVYVLRSLFDSATRPATFWFWIEVLGLFIFVGLAVLGVKRSPWFLAVGIVAHGLTWDSWHYRNSAYIPDWYAIGCMLVDFALGAYVAARVPAYQRASRTETEN